MPRGGDKARRRAAWSWKDVKPAARRPVAPAAMPAIAARPLPPLAEASRFADYPPIQRTPPRAAPTPRRCPPPPPGWADELEQQLRDLVHQGLTSGQIAARMGFSRSAIVGKCDRLGLRLCGNTAHKRISLSSPPRPRAWVQGRKLPPAPLPRPATPSPRPPAPIPMPIMEPPAWTGVEPEPLGGAGLTIMELDAASCRWPIDPGEDSEWRYCGHPRDDRIKLSSYCTAHLCKSRSRWLKPKRARLAS
jgi:GcrA cell cycle regulator